jgi:hypothetical protein
MNPEPGLLQNEDPPQVTSKKYTVQICIVLIVYFGSSEFPDLGRFLSLRLCFVLYLEGRFNLKLIYEALKTLMLKGQGIALLKLLFVDR